MKRDGDVIYVYDGTFDGFLSCVFEAYAKKERPALISKSARVQLTIGANIRHIKTVSENADRVFNGIRQKLGQDILRSVYRATLSAEEDAETAALRFLRLGFKRGKAVFNALTDPAVMRFNEVVRAVEREAGRYLEFLRFSELEGGILFGEFEPEPHVLPVIMPHFADRLSSQPFIIHDTGRWIAGVYDTREWLLVSSSEMTLPELSGSEVEYRSLWKLFYNTIAVKERVNPRLQMQLLPKKYWKYLTEMQF